MNSHGGRFGNERLDLTQVEGLADLVAAETEAQRRQALRQSDGTIARLYEGWRERLVKARALIEAELDFADEEDIPESASGGAWAIAEAVREGNLSTIWTTGAASGCARAWRSWFWGRQTPANRAWSTRSPGGTWRS